MFLHICRPNKLAVEGEAIGDHCPTSTAKLPPATTPRLLEPPVARCNVKDKNLGYSEPELRKENIAQVPNAVVTEWSTLRKVGAW